MKRAVSAVAALMLVATGGAFAETSAIEMQGMMKPFYSDSEMKTMRSEEEVKTIMSGMSAEDQEAMKTACSENADQSFKGFCDNVMRAMGDR